ncbi:MAG: helix-turn-helix transcriptional regulator [Elusimicrobia bacterium]|nr:helix-turn-helix transcriptional regulator [Elusimicrobiota bacterium]
MKTKRSFFATQLKKLMFEKNLTQEDLAKKIKINRQMISYWLNSGKNPSLTSVKKIADALKAPMSYFVVETTIEKNEENKNLSVKIELLEEKIKRHEIEINYLKDIIKNFIKK